MKNNTPKNTDNYDRDSTGKFIVGNSGKPKGATNKSSRELKEMITAFLNDKIEDLYNIWNSLDKREQAILFINLSKIIIPKEDVEEQEKFRGITEIIIEPKE